MPRDISWEAPTFRVGGHVHPPKVRLKSLFCWGASITTSLAGQYHEVLISTNDVRYNVRYIVQIYKMPHISKRKLDERHIQDLFMEIVSVLEKAGRRGKLRLVLGQLLTFTEKIMLAKRLAVVAMLDQKIPIHDIAESLYMSPSTIDIMSLKFETEKYSYVIKNGIKRTDIGDIIRMIQTVGGIMPPRGKGRWKFLDDSMRRDRISSRIKKLAEKNRKTKGR